MSINRVSFYSFWACFIFVIILSLPTLQRCVESPKIAVKTDSIFVYVDRCNKDVDWDTFIEALIWVESKGDTSAVGNCDDTGVLQITPIIVEDCNRILGGEAYTLGDRKDSLKSVGMFNVIQEFYNPDRDLHLALKIWNSKAPLSYHTKVINEYSRRKEAQDVDRP